MLKRTGLKQTEAFISSAVTLNLCSKKRTEKGDVIIKLDNQNIATYADLSGYINTKRPNDKVDVTILRDGTVKHFRSLSKRYSAEFKGIELENIVPLIKEIQCKLWC
jgi:S1-C subfamily serine protease